MTRFALDSSALVAWVTQENSRWRRVEALLTQPGSQPILPGPGLTETIAVARRKGNTSSGATLRTVFLARGIVVEQLADQDLVRAAELLEESALNPGPPHPSSGLTPTLSLGDALILAIVERLGIPVVTADTYWQGFSLGGHTSATVVLL